MFKKGEVIAVRRIRHNWHQNMQTDFTMFMANLSVQSRMCTLRQQRLNCVSSARHTYLGTPAEDQNEYWPPHINCEPCKIL